MIDIYNRGDKRAFYAYNPVRYGTVNASERLRKGIRSIFGGGIDPIIKQANDGELLGIDIGSPDIIVFPKFSLNINEAIYKPGALGEIFECQGYKYQKTHVISEVIKPAEFFGDENHLVWPPIEKGILKLRQVDI